ncbi:kynurenine/alpha-aminoadipate aminotransferase, mitochondrial isoform X1 [Procambarus clarkii]|uniref:kynurenine/alpha-aminoadipate aminotransferase, mitochondrial isoform X1 n=2 Tax=Procambarus clarkii TaxID=6728 RepID=UPI001E6736E1|nr:kynurenine/alpha-aminoadipate aminotransferase, mitochondrial-like isoform X1 [Procambarus clarkii]
MDYSKFISTTSAKRKPSGISEMRAHLDKPSPSLVWLASGMPNPEKFPFREVNITLQDGRVLSLPPDCLSSGLQYGPTQGYIPLVKQLKAMTKQFHSPPQWEKCDLLVTVGCQAGLSMAFEMLLNPGDFIVLSNPCYSDVLCMLSGMDLQYLAIEDDAHGMKPDILRAALTQAVERGTNGVPKALYVVPNGNNPTGTTMDMTRRQEIYDIAHDYDLIILEDDPYFFLQYDEYEQPLPSFLSLDTDGRVLRFDSFSKIISSGLRVGYVTGPAPLVERLNVHMQARVICGPMLSQVVMSELLKEWGEDGLKKHIADLRTFYCDKRNAIIKAAEMHLSGLCEWTVPKGGIFLWLKVPELEDTGPMLIQRAIKKDIALVPGKDFVVDSSKPCQYMRAAFSCATADEMMKGMENLAKLLREEITLQNAQP